jgi:hypothetical protein
MMSSFLIWLFAWLFRFETFFQIAQRLKTMAFVFADPALGDLVDRHRIEVMQLLAPAPDDSDQIRRLQQQEMFGDRLPRHVEVRAQFAERLPVVFVQLVEQRAPAFVRQGFEYCIHLRDIMQPKGCMSSGELEGALRNPPAALELCVCGSVGILVAT